MAATSLIFYQCWQQPAWFSNSVGSNKLDFLSVLETTSLIFKQCWQQQAWFSISVGNNQCWPQPAWFSIICQIVFYLVEKILFWQTILSFLNCEYSFKIEFQNLSRSPLQSLPKNNKANTEVVFSASMRNSSFDYTGCTLAVHQMNTFLYTKTTFFANSRGS